MILTAKMSPVGQTQAEAFVKSYSDYLFQDAHYFVEAAAILQAKEVAPNRFLFADGSQLEILTHRAQVVCRPA